MSSFISPSYQRMMTQAVLVLPTIERVRSSPGDRTLTNSREVEAEIIVLRRTVLMCFRRPLVGSRSLPLRYHHFYSITIQLPDHAAERCERIVQHRQEGVACAS
jgi:hypothetical protein